LKLYSLNHSPYATRVRTVIRKKGLDVQIAAPTEALRTEEFVAHFPMGKIPVLELDDGSQLPDSWVIMEYLDATGGGPTLTPDTTLERAHMQLLARYADTYLSPGGLFPLFNVVVQGRVAEGAGAEMASLDAELARFERLLGMLPDFAGRNINLGDIALVPHLDFVQMLTPLFGNSEPLASYPRVAAWYRWVLADEAVAESSREMAEATAAFFSAK
jgi:glutathione S-transferase